MKISFERPNFLKSSYYFTIENSESKYLLQPSLVEGPEILLLKAIVQQSRFSERGKMNYSKHIAL